MKKNIQERSFDFAVNVIKATRTLARNQKEYVLSKQLLRSGTAIVALVNEAQYAESKRDFLHKMSIALKESKETECWLKLMSAAGVFDDPMLQKENEEILRILVAITKTAKQNLEKPK